MPSLTDTCMERLISFCRAFHDFLLPILIIGLFIAIWASAHGVHVTYWRFTPSGS